MVENAIYHGVRQLEKPGGLITVKSYSNEEDVYFEIIDNGLGIPASIIEDITNCLQGAATVGDEKRFFGLKNVHERIVLAFGKEYGLKIESVINKGTKVTIHIPLIG